MRHAVVTREIATAPDRTGHTCHTGRGPVSRSGPEEPRTAGRMRPPDQSGLQWEIAACLGGVCHLQFDVEKLYGVAVAGLLDTIEAVPQADGHPRRARHLGQRVDRLPATAETDVQESWQG